MSAPTLQELPSAFPGCRQYRAEGGTLRQDWAEHLRPGEAAWCEFSTWNGKTLGSYGGSVWPTAWPEMFEAGRGTAQTGPWTRFTEAGKAWLASAQPAPGAKEAKP